MQALTRALSAKVYDIEDGANAREKHVARNHITWSLHFVNPIDEELYLISLKNLFFFPTFWPIMCVFLAFIATQNGVLQEIQGGDPFLAISFSCNLICLAIIIVYTFAQCIDYFQDRASPQLMDFSRYFLRKFLGGRMEDLVILLLAMAQGFYQISLITRDLCLACGTIFTIEKCDGSIDRDFPMNQAIIGYIALLSLSIYFKSINRHVVLTSWAILTVFIIAAHAYGKYHVKYITAILCVFFLVSLFEYERYKMTSYLLSKEALSLEKNKLIIMQEKSKIIERKLHMALVHQILPPKVAEQIIAGKQVAPESFDEVTIFFSDVEGFTTICSQVTPAEVVRMLNDLYTVMDYCTSLFPVYKVETIGDAYMLVGGLPVRDPNHAQSIADFALLVQTAVRSVKSPIDGTPIRIRIGIHSGPVMAGVVGNLMPRYCLFGDTVNTASRMESNGSPGLIHCSEKTAQILIKAGKHIVSERGQIEVKGKGIMTTYWLDRAAEDNKQSNQDAIDKCQRMVEDILYQESSSNINGQSISLNNLLDRDPLHHPSSSARLNSYSNDFNGNLHINTSVSSGTNDDVHNSHYDHANAVNSFSKSHHSNAYATKTETPEKPPHKPAGNRRQPSNEQFDDLQSVNDGDNVESDGKSLGVASLTSNNTVTTPNHHNTSTNLNNSGSGQQNAPVHHNSSGTNNTSSNNNNSFHPRGPGLRHHKSAESHNYHTKDGVFDSSGAKILVVEDSPAQRKVLLKKLQEADSTWDLSFAISGEDALAKLKAAKFAFDVVFVDENLSISDGLFGHELVQVMRESFHMKSTIIIACTSNPAKVGKDLLEAGVDFVWPKPPPLPAVIKTKINMLLEAKLKQIGQQQHEEHKVPLLHGIGSHPSSAHNSTPNSAHISNNNSSGAVNGNASSNNGSNGNSQPFSTLRYLFGRQ